MTVRELIEALQEHDPDMEVASYDSGHFFWAIPPQVRVMHTSPKMAGGPWECSDPHFPCMFCQQQRPKEPVLVLQALIEALARLMEPDAASASDRVILGCTSFRNSLH